MPFGGLDMTYVIIGVVIVLIAIVIWKARHPKVDDEEFKERLGDYNQGCRLVKLDYRGGKLSAEEARARLEEIGDTYRIPHYRRTKSLGTIQIRQLP